MEERRSGKTPLTAEAGQIIRNEIFKEGPITVRFRGAILSPSGEVTQIEISQDRSAVYLTKDQALSLAKEVRRKFGD